MSAPCVVYLTRRNLVTLLNKLNRNKRAGRKESACSIVKMDRKHKKYPQDHVVTVTALENEEYYTDRNAGDMHHKDAPTDKQLKKSYDTAYVLENFDEYKK